jgi:hypothetical protein
MSDLVGGCLCGAVRLQISGLPRRIGLCHCMTCRKESGGPFKHFAVFADASVTISGMTVHWTSREGVKRYFCPTCGSHVFERVPDSIEIEINAGILDEPNHLPPTYEVWCDRRERWLPDLHLTRYPKAHTTDPAP